jgi:hypothetical protein
MAGFTICGEASVQCVHSKQPQFVRERAVHQSSDGRHPTRQSESGDRKRPRRGIGGWGAGGRKGGFSCGPPMSKSVRE